MLTYEDVIITLQMTFNLERRNKRYKLVVKMQKKNTCISAMVTKPTEYFNKEHFIAHGYILATFGCIIKDFST